VFYLKDIKALVVMPLFLWMKLKCGKICWILNVGF